MPLRDSVVSHETGSFTADLVRMSQASGVSGDRVAPGWVEVRSCAGVPPVSPVVLGSWVRGCGVRRPGRDDPVQVADDSVIGVGEDGAPGSVLIAMMCLAPAQPAMYLMARPMPQAG